SLDAKTVVRGGFGMGYDVLYDNLGILSAAPQYQITEDVPSLTVHTPNFLSGGGLPATSTFTTLAQQRAKTTSYVPDQELPYAENWSLGVERTFAQNYTFEARYLGTHGVSLPTQNRLNRQSVTTASNSLPFYFAPTTNNSATAMSYSTVASTGSSFVPAYAAAGFTSSIVAFMPYTSSM